MASESCEFQKETKTQQIYPYCNMAHSEECQFAFKEKKAND